MTFQYGLEVEYTPQDAAQLLATYRPVARYTEQTADWERWTLKDRQAWLLVALHELPFGDHSPMLEVQDLRAELPSSIHRDDSGTVEFTLPPRNTLRDLELDLARVQAVAGPGSIQVTVSIDHDAFFGAIADRKSRLQELLGWFNFHHQFDILERLLRNGARTRFQPSTPIGQFLQHPFLGPMNTVRHHLLRKTLCENAHGRMWDRAELGLIIRREHSFKYVGSTAYRPDLAGPARICLEIRDGHKDAGVILARVHRIENDFARGLKDFAAFAEVPAFDADQSFQCLPLAVQEELRSIFHRPINEAMREFPKAVFAHETFRNFALPFAPWDAWLRAFDRDDLLTGLTTARARYVASLEKLDAKEAAGQRRQEVGRALLAFVQESGLWSAFFTQREALSRAAV